MKRVLVSEVGDLKRELVYFGDTINVAAGLQSLCKEEGAERWSHRRCIELCSTRRNYNLAD
ncbi:MAG: hypothetical protein V7739_15510 [Motiliproteus sp.]